MLVSPTVEGLPTPQHKKASAMAMLHSFYCWGQVAVVAGTTLLPAVFAVTVWRFRGSGRGADAADQRDEAIVFSA